ncbi:MAG: hypothetical protein ACRDBY_12985 [Cetobacterium sp.]
MGQRLNVSIRKNDEVLVSAYWHWGGFTSSSLAIAKQILEVMREVSDLDSALKYYGYESLSVGILEAIGCKIFNDRNSGRMLIGGDQDTSEANITIDLDWKTINISDVFNEIDEDYTDEVFTPFTLNYLPIIPLKDALNVISTLIDNKYTIVDFNGCKLQVIE